MTRRESGRRGGSARPIVLMLALAAPGCSLAIGDIELPQAQSAKDQGGLPRDADTDALPADAAPPPGDAAPPLADAAPPPTDAPMIAPDGTPPPPADAFVAPPDAEPPPPADAFVPPPDVPVAPPPDLSGLAGFWYVDGFVPNERGEYEAFSAALRINRRSADLRSNLGEPIAEDVSLVPAPDLYGTWLFTLPTTGVVYRGAFAPNTGFAVFAPDTLHDPGAAGALLIMARANENAPVAPPDTLAYTRIGRAPADGDGEFGTLRQTDADTFAQEYRYPAPPIAGLLPDRGLDFRSIDPWRWSLRDPVLGDEFELVPTYQGTGVIAVERRPDAGGVGLLLGWTGRAPAAGPRAGDLFCAGLAWDAAGVGVAPLGLSATLAGDGTLAWVGGYRQTLTTADGIYILSDGLNPFLQNGGIALSDEHDEVIVVTPFDPAAARTAWGMMACVRTDVVPVPN